MKTVCEALGDVQTKWFKIGISLGISRNKLDEFKNDADPLSAVIDYLLRGNTKVPVSWESIVTALNSKHVGEPGLGKKIQEDYCQQESMPYSNPIVNES